MRIVTRTRHALAVGVSSLALIAGHATAQTADQQAADQQSADAQQGNAPAPTAPTTNTVDGATSRSTDAAVAGAPAPDAREGTTAPAQALDAPAAANQASESDDIIVTGIRSSLANSQNIKRNADTVVDAITAEDIGALPDRSVTEALQRVPGVSVTRFNAGNDPDHFSVEGSGVVVRGLSYVRSEFNGRDTFSTNGGRGLFFQDVSPELLGSVEVFKNLASDMIEGGIAGTVNLNTRKPFDSREPVVYLSADLNYGEFANKGAPAISGLASKNWDTGIGRFGLLVGGSYSQLFSRADGLQISKFEERFNGSRDTNGDGTPETDTFPGVAPGSVVYAPVGAGVRSQRFNRERIGAAAAAQFQSNDESLLATLQFVRTDARETWGERTFETDPGAATRQTFPAAGSSFTFDDDGVFQSGTITLDRGANPPPFTPRTGIQAQLSNRGVKDRAVTDDFGANVKWDATDRLHFNFDAQYVRSTNESIDFSVFGSTFANVSIDNTGDEPDIRFLPPGGGDPQSYFGNPANSFARAAMDHFEDNEGKEWAFRGDAAYDLSDEGFLRRLKVGARYADRDQTVRYTLYNWGALSEVWAGPSPVYFNELAPDSYGVQQFDDQFRNKGSGSQVIAPYFNDNPAANYDLLRDRALAANAIWRSRGGFQNWTPAGERTGVIAGTRFLPSEIYGNSEATKAAYARLDFSTDGGGFLGGIDIAGNVGVRYVRTTDKANGFLTVPTRAVIAGGQDPATYCAGQGATNNFCRLTPAQQQAVITFSNGAAFERSSKNKFDHWLPSVNLKVGITPKLISRFAYSRAISRPGFGQLQNTILIQPQFDTPVFQLTGGSRGANPDLRPIEADQFDVTLEWYFARVGSLTGALFYKNLKNVIINGVAQVEPVTNNGVTQDVVFVGPQNSGEDGKVKGVEIAYQQSFDFLPGVLGGLGAKIGYTYIDSSGIPQQAAIPSTQILVDYSQLPLEQLSKHTVNAEAFYEKGPLAVRFAYNWRSKYLLTVRDEIAPNVPIFNDAYGQLDGSMIYTINDHFKIGFQFVNLLDSTTKTLSVINSAGDTAPRSYFKNDTRISLTTRMKF